MVILGLGSNKGDRSEFLRTAINLLRGVISDIRLSPVYESKALLPPGADSSWDHHFLNMAVAGHTELSPEALLAEVKSIEKRLGRKPSMTWSPREIDIDILAMDDRVVALPGLNVPHHELINRDFALIPFSDLAPTWRYPVHSVFFGMTAAELVAKKKFACGKTLWRLGMEAYG